MAVLDSVQSVADVIQNLPTSGRVIIGIVGPPGAGKSTIAASLVDLLPAAALLPMDGFHLPQAKLRRLGRRDRMGAPDTFDVDGFLEVLRAVRRGETVTAPGFDREIEEPVPGALPIDAPIVVVEGNYLLHWAEAAALFDATFYVELADDIRLQRLIARHERFGKSPVDARAWALGPDEHNARIIAATAGLADHRIRLA
jgi:pantothenate kinase